MLTEEQIQEIKQALAITTDDSEWHAETEKWPGNNHLQYWISTQYDGFACAVRLEDALFIAKSKGWITHLIADYETLQQQNKQLIEALEHYADRSNHPPFWLYDDGEKARTALRQIQGNT